MSEPVFHERPWGGYCILDEGPLYLTKRLLVNPGQQTSLQRHARRTEYWTVVVGEGEYIEWVEETEYMRRMPLNTTPRAYATVMVAPGTWHRIRNTGDGPLVIIETWLGDTLSEDDIERLEDDYGRV